MEYSRRSCILQILADRCYLPVRGVSARRSLSVLKGRLVPADEASCRTAE